MPVAIVLDLVMTGPPADETDQSICDTLAAMRAEGMHEHTSAYHDLVAAIAYVKMRQHIELAAFYRGLERDAARRKARSRARRLARQQATDPANMEAPDGSASP